MNTDKLWKAALGELELRLSPVHFLTWFRQTKIKERKGPNIIIETESPFIYEWLSKKYRSLILEVLQGIDKTIGGIDFTVLSRASSFRSARRATRIFAQKTRPIKYFHPLSSTFSPPIQRSPVQDNRPVQFNIKYTFETFIVGPSNEIAHAACQAVVAKPGQMYNPLFIYGGVGLGKTHLLQATGNALLQKNPSFHILYVASEKFMNEFVDSLRRQKTQEFKKKYRDVDMFIIDDVQFLAGKKQTQEELFHTFNALHGQDKQVILSSDRPPSAIPAFQERLSSRLSAGMIADIKKPDYETRLAILEDKVRNRGAQITAEARTFIAKNIQTNVRELEGALNRVIAFSELHKKEITPEEAQKILSDIINTGIRRTIDTRQIIETVSVYYNVSIDEICGKRRNKEIVRPRQIAMYLLRKENNMSFPSIGTHFGGRDHTTAMHACDKIEKLLERDDELTQEINFLRERLYV